MTNREFIKAMEFQFYNLNTSRPFALYFGRFESDGVLCKIFNNSNHLFDLRIKIGKRKLSGEISYHNILDCLHSPYELQRWCCNTFAGRSNFFSFISALENDLDFVVKSHPSLCCPF